MLSPESLNAFVLAADLGSFSAAARRMGKVQSAVSMAIANLEIDCGLTLFDRSGRSPVLTDEGRALLPHARGILLGNRELLATANSLAEGIETHLSLSVEKGISITPLLDLLDRFSKTFPSTSLEISTTTPSESAERLRQGMTDIGLMTEQEGYPSGLQFRGVGYTKLIPVCAPGHALAEFGQARYGDLRQHRQIIRHKSPLEGTVQKNEKKSAIVWLAEDPQLIVDLVRAGLGWAELPGKLVSEFLEAGDLVQIRYAFQQNDLLEGIDLVWTEQRALGIAGQWIHSEILKLSQTIWQDD